MSSEIASGVNLVALVFGLVNGTLFIISECLSYFNKHSTRSTSLTELVLRKLRLISEPTLDEVLEHLQSRREQTIENVP